MEDIDAIFRKIGPARVLGFVFGSLKGNCDRKKEDSRKLGRIVATRSMNGARLQRNLQKLNAKAVLIVQDKKCRADRWISLEEENQRHHIHRTVITS